MFLLIWDNPSKCVVDTLEFVHVQTSQTSEERITIVKVNTCQRICYKDRSLISQILSNLPEIMQLNETSLKIIVDIISDKNIRIKQYPHREVGI